jgi:hypothetical protein
MCVFVALVIHPERRMGHITSSVAALVAPCFSTLSKKGKVFGKKIEHKMCVKIFSTTFVCNVSHSGKK